MSKYGVKRPYKYTCPNCGHTGKEINYGSHTVQFIEPNEMPALKIEFYGCPKCGQMWDVEYKISYKVSNIVKKGFDDRFEPLGKYK